MFLVILNFKTFLGSGILPCEIERGVFKEEEEEEVGTVMRYTSLSL